MSGVKMARARFRRICGTAGTRTVMVKGEGQVKKSEAQSTDAQYGGGPVCSSVDFRRMSI